METLGPQYSSDNAFKKLARRHQSAFRANFLRVPYDGFGNMLQEQDAKRGVNFYGGFDVYQAVKERYPEYKKQLYANLLRSEHIPLNVFIPFRTEKELFVSVIAEAFGIGVKKVDSIRIEYAPEPVTEYLNDKTSFDAFCEGEDTHGDRFFLGIEVKYTEGDYKMGHKESQFCSNPESTYNQITKRSGMYKPGAAGLLKTDTFRQVWRNQLLAESILQRDRTNYRYYRSILLYPSGNTHIARVVRDYKGLLTEAHQRSFQGITFEEFFSSIEKHARSTEARTWATYLKQRYCLLEDSAEPDIS
jgi:hypothetical protein